MNQAKPKHPGGRPTMYNKKYCKRAVELGKEGKTVVYLATELGVAKQTIYNWGALHPEFMDALQCQKDGAEQWLLTRAQERVSGGNVGASDTLIKFLLSSAHGYREKSDVVSQSEITHKVVVSDWGANEESDSQD